MLAPWRTCEWHKGATTKKTIAHTHVSLRRETYLRAHTQLTDPGEGARIECCINHAAQVTSSRAASAYTHNMETLSDDVPLVR